MNAVDSLVELILKTSGKTEKTYPYETEAVVRRVEDGVAYVKIGESYETPADMSISAAPGERVKVRVANNRAYIVGNGDEPPTGDRVARHAMTRAVEAKTEATVALTTAQGAQESADIAADAASRAQASADSAEVDAKRANVAANNAELDAQRANTAANNALTQVAIVEDVAGTLRWIQEHGQYILTQDTSVQEGKVYFIYNSTSQDYEPIVSPDPEANPYSEGWYELDITDSQTEYIMAHLAVTSRGLWVLPSGLNEGSVTRTYIKTVDETVQSGTTYYTYNESTHTYNEVVSPDPSANPSEEGWYVLETEQDARARTGDKYKILLSNNGLYIYDEDGHVVTTYGESITFSSDRPQYIGNQNAYIVFNPQNGGSITIGGSNITLGSDRTLDELIAEVDGTLIYDHTYEVVNGVATFQAQLYRGGVDVHTQYNEEQFLWFYKKSDDTTLYPLNTGSYADNKGYSCTVDLSVMGYGGHVVGKFTSSNDSPILTENDDNLTDENDHSFTARTESGNSVRVSDLSVSTTIYPTDKVMIVGLEDEHLVTIQTLSDTLDKHYVYTQSVVADTWNIQHNLNKFPSISVVDSADSQVEGDVEYVDANNVTLRFCGAFSGKAYLN